MSKLPEGRQPLSWRDMPFSDRPRGHPSTERLEIEKLKERVAELEAAIEMVMVGGNHIALIIGTDHPPHTVDHNTALASYGAGVQYEAWCAWKAIMEARDALKGKDDE